MLISYNWLTKYFDEDLPDPEELADILTMHAYEVEEVAQKDTDTILDIDVLPDRAADSLSHIGVAREVGVLLEREPAFDYGEAQTNASLSSTNHIDLSIESDHVRRATKRLVADVEVKDSSKEIKNTLASLGQKSINNIVDLTNYVMFETGQPVHAFDYDKLAGEAPKDIVIREAEAGESITTLDGDEYELEEGMLVIADEEKPLDIAGIKGGMNSHIDESTERIMLSVCSFNPTKIRTTSQKLNLRTDASKRFENDVSPELVRPAIERLSALIKKHAAGQVAADICDSYPQPANSYATGVSVKRANSLLGTNVSQDEAKSILERLSCDVSVVDPASAVVEKARDFIGRPYELGASVRFDAPEIFDCSSFTSFLFAHYGGVSIPRMSVDQLVYGTPVAKEEMQPGDVVFSNTKEGKIHTETKEFMPGTEVPDGVDHCGLYLGDGAVIHATRYAGEVVVEPLDESDQFEHIVGVRRMADSERLQVTVPYWRRDITREEDLIEEIGRVYGYENISPTLPEAASDQPPVHKTFYYTQKIRDTLTDAGSSEVYTYAFGQEGEIALENPVAEDKAYLRASLLPGLRQALKTNKKHKELLDSRSIHIFEIGKVFTQNHEQLQLGLASTADDEMVQSAVTSLQDELGVELKQRTTEDSGNGHHIITINLASVMKQLDQPESYDQLQSLTTDVTYQPPSQFPYVLRDIAFWAPQDVKSQQSEAERLLQEAGGDWLVNIKLFDEYDPEGDDRVSLAYRLVFQSHERTLEDEEVNQIMDGVYEAVEEKGWEVR